MVILSKEKVKEILISRICPFNDSYFNIPIAEIIGIQNSALMNKIQYDDPEQRAVEFITSKYLLGQWKILNRIDIQKFISKALLDDIMATIGKKYINKVKDDDFSVDIIYDERMMLNKLTLKMVLVDDRIVIFTYKYPTFICPINRFHSKDSSMWISPYTYDNKAISEMLRSRINETLIIICRKRAERKYNKLKKAKEADYLASKGLTEIIDNGRRVDVLDGFDLKHPFHSNSTQMPTLIAYNDKVLESYTIRFSFDIGYTPILDKKTIDYVFEHSCKAFMLSHTYRKIFGDNPNGINFFNCNICVTSVKIMEIQFTFKEKLKNIFEDELDFIVCPYDIKKYSTRRRAIREYEKR